MGMVGRMERERREIGKEGMGERGCRRPKKGATEWPTAMGVRVEEGRNAVSIFFFKKNK